MMFEGSERTPKIAVLVMINPEDLESIDFIDFKELLEVVIFITSKKGTLVSNFFYYYVSSVS